MPVSSDLRSKAGERGTVSGSSFFLISASDPGQPAYIDAQSCSPCGPCSRRGDLPRSCGVRLTVFDILGRVVTVLVTGRMEAGHHTVRFDASGLARGVYLYQMQARTTDLRSGGLFSTDKENARASIVALVPPQEGVGSTVAGGSNQKPAISAVFVKFLHAVTDP